MEKEKRHEGNEGKPTFFVTISCMIAVATIVLSFMLWQKWQYGVQIKTLTSIAPRAVTIFKVYPRVNGPLGTPVVFKTPEALIDEFFQALTDQHSYSEIRDTVDFDEQRWFMEIATEKMTIFLSFYIPHGKAEIVVGGFHYGYGSLQSHLLYQWYQKYKNRWLQPTPSPQPTATPQ
jgi:hypothetical protein